MECRTRDISLGTCVNESRFSLWQKASSARPPQLGQSQNLHYFAKSVTAEHTGEDMYVPCVRPR